MLSSAAAPARPGGVEVLGGTLSIAAARPTIGGCGSLSDGVLTGHRGEVVAQEGTARLLVALPGLADPGGSVRGREPGDGTGGRMAFPAAFHSAPIGQRTA